MPRDPHGTGVGTDAKHFRTLPHFWLLRPPKHGSVLFFVVGDARPRPVLHALLPEEIFSPPGRPAQEKSPKHILKR